MLNVSVAFSLTESSKHLEDDIDLTSHHRFFFYLLTKGRFLKGGITLFQG